MRLRLLGVAIAVAVGVMNIGLAPAAGGNAAKPSPPGQEKTRPGQAAKDEGKPEKSIPPGQLDKETTDSAPSANKPAPTEHVQAASSEEASSSDPKPKHAAKSSVTKDADPKPDRPAKQDIGTPASSPHAKSPSAHGNSAVAHTHVIICHRTGSRSNPYVVINISMSAWLQGHTTHPARNGHNDILLKQGAAPGEKMPRSACGSPVTPNSPKPPVVDPVPPLTPTDTPRTPSAPPTGKPADPSTPAGPLVPPALPKEKPGHADSGVAAHVEAGVLQELPFTGLPLWIAVFAGCLLLGTGVAIRKASWAPSKAEADLTPPGRRT
jgi:hypothetical protein